MDLSPVLMRMAGPYAAVVLALDLAAVYQARGNLHGVDVDHPAGPVVALGEFGLWRSLGIAAVHLAFAGYLFWAAPRRTPGVMALTGLVTGLYLIGLLTMMWFNPISGFPPRGYSSPPFDRLDPPWYFPSLIAVLWAAALTQMVALVLAVRATDRRPAGRGSLLLVAGPVLAVSGYAAANLVAIRMATEPKTPTDLFGRPWTGSSRASLVERAWATAGLLGQWLVPLTVTALAVALLGLLMWRRGVTPGTVVPAYLLSVPYAAFLALFTWLHPLSGAMNFDDQTGYVDQSPDWLPAALVALCAVAIVTQAAALLLTSRRLRAGS